ncbi:hypothetical protein V7S43_002008 [Phytophthora oleae]|uniref:Crinkler effector protein N-terminal domain-containing protein n=1 Tax=Phytophthora oleae TaxID=2107226 RepID=A0ABD3G3Y8_9STRA
MVYLFCAIVGVVGSVFPVDIDVSKPVGALKTAIKDDNPNTFQCDAQAAALSVEEGRGRSGGSEKTNSASRNRPNKKIGDFFGNAPTEEVIHVLVVARSHVSVATRLDCSAEWLTEFLSKEVKFHLLPPVASLKEFVKQALPVKIPMESKVLTSWSFYLNNHDQDQLFTTDDVASCEKIETKVKNMLDPLRSGDTASSFIWFWDTMIRSLLGFLFVFADYGRNTCENSSTERKLPDFVFLLNDVCVFRGEEEEPRVNITSPRDEMCENLVWMYGSVPYVFAYAASATRSVYLLSFVNPPRRLKSRAFLSKHLTWSVDQIDFVLFSRF